MDEWTLDAWLEDERQRLDRFAAEWRKSMTTDPELYPAVMPNGEWDEQYRSWCGG